MRARTPSMSPAPLGGRTAGATVRHRPTQLPQGLGRPFGFVRAPNCLEYRTADPPLPLPNQGRQLANFVVRVVSVLFVSDEHCQHHFGLPVR
jgi:hypothetical protein